MGHQPLERVSAVVGQQPGQCLTLLEPRRLERLGMEVPADLEVETGRHDPIGDRLVTEGTRHEAAHRQREDPRHFGGGEVEYDDVDVAFNTRRSVCLPGLEFR